MKWKMFKEDGKLEQMNNPNRRNIRIVPDYTYKELQASAKLVWERDKKKIPTRQGNLRKKS